MRRCAGTRCPNLVPQGQRYCPTHQADYEARRGTTTQRGYGNTHQRERQRWEARLRVSPFPCTRCGRPITPGDTWHLDHADDDRNRYLGPAHATCNTAAGGRRAHHA